MRVRTAPRILNLGNKWRRVVSFIPHRYTTGQRGHVTCREGGWMDPGAGPDAVEERTPAGIEPQLPVVQLIV
jgi:hypothetical protein